MSEPRKNHLSIDGAQIKEDDHVSSYKPIPETDTEFRSSKNNLAKSKEKISPDGAEEKLLPKEEEAKIVTRVDMADAKYVVEDHRNGDAKIELDANKRQFSGLTKEELMKYADDPFWVNLRWFMFILFWAMWVCMLAGAITIIIKAPKCAPPPSKTWFEEGPLVDMGEATFSQIEPDLPNLKTHLIQGIFVDVPTYHYESPTFIENFQKFAAKAKEYGIKVIVDLIPNYVRIDHEWFSKSVNKDPLYSDYFVWAPVREHDADNKPVTPNNWISTMNTSAWTLNDTRGEFYLHQYRADQPDLNFNNEQVVLEMDKAIRSWMKAGAVGVRLNKARQLLVNANLTRENLANGKDKGFVHTDYGFWRHQFTSDQPGLDKLLSRWAGVVTSASETPDDAVFTLEEEGDRVELFLLSRNVTSLRPVMTAPIIVSDNLTAFAENIRARLKKWPAMQLKSTTDGDEELALFALVLPAAPVFEPHQLRSDNETTTTEALSHVIPLRQNPTVQYGQYHVVAVPARNRTEDTLIACARWKTGHSGYVAVYNPSALEQRANLTAVTSLPATLTVHHMSHTAKLYANESSSSESVDDIFVPPRATVILSYVPKTAVEK